MSAVRACTLINIVGVVLGHGGVGCNGILSLLQNYLLVAM